MKKKEKELIVKQNGKTRNIKVSHRFVTTLSIVSILGFITIFMSSLFYIDLNKYLEFAWLFIIGSGLVWEGRLQTFKKIKEEGLTSNNFAQLITIIIGFIAMLVGLLSFPGIELNFPSFHAVKGIISIIAIVIIIVQTWILE